MPVIIAFLAVGLLFFPVVHAILRSLSSWSLPYTLVCRYNKIINHSAKEEYALYMIVVYVFVYSST
jgi:hypothetical protein